MPSFVINWWETAKTKTALKSTRTVKINTTTPLVNSSNPPYMAASMDSAPHSSSPSPQLDPEEAPVLFWHLE